MRTSATAEPDAPQAAWRKSSFSGGNNNCVEWARAAGGGCYVRDSKNPAGPALLVTAEAWSSFVTAVSAGEFVGPEADVTAAHRPGY
ncbi:DUF397 domain-containing protein [Streptomyces sp. NPDC002055]|uniref:DUF397 domain-containing protein n=1 Tax=Streptomyces sp. NPDC002055 TaxID=3154534 RepID=UPI00332FDCC3